MLILVFLMPSILHVVIRDMGQTLQGDICYNQHEMIKVCFTELRKSIYDYCKKNNNKTMHVYFCFETKRKETSVLTVLKFNHVPWQVQLAYLHTE